MTLSQWEFVILWFKHIFNSSREPVRTQVCYWSFSTTNWSCLVPRSHINSDPIPSCSFVYNKNDKSSEKNYQWPAFTKSWWIPNCVNCNKLSPSAISPHPSLFASTRVIKRLSSQKV
jgi:hypothetical protein